MLQASGADSHAEEKDQRSLIVDGDSEETQGLAGEDHGKWNSSQPPSLSSPHKLQLDDEDCSEEGHRGPVDPDDGAEEAHASAYENDGKGNLLCDILAHYRILKILSARVDFEGRKRRARTT
jgi:hypothetical protein